MRNELNAFLALLEGRPEIFHEVLQGQVRRSQIPITIKERICKAAENIKYAAIKEAIREAYKRTLRLDPSLTMQEDSAKEAFYTGVEAVEEILGEILATCEAAEKKLGPTNQIIP